MIPRYFAIFWRYRYHKSTDGTGTKKVPRYFSTAVLPTYALKSEESYCLENGKR